MSLDTYPRAVNASRIGISLGNHTTCVSGNAALAVIRTHAPGLTASSRTMHNLKQDASISCNVPTFLFDTWGDDPRFQSDMDSWWEPSMVDNPSRSQNCSRLRLVIFCLLVIPSAKLCATKSRNPYSFIASCHPLVPRELVYLTILTDNVRKPVPPLRRLFSLFYTPYHKAYYCIGSAE
jgi:hypothetical protein